MTRMKKLACSVSLILAGASPALADSSADANKPAAPKPPDAPKSLRMRPRQKPQVAQAAPDPQPSAVRATRDQVGQDVPAQRFDLRRNAGEVRLADDDELEQLPHLVVGGSSRPEPVEVGGVDDLPERRGGDADGDPRRCGRAG